MRQQTSRLRSHPSGRRPRIHLKRRRLTTVAGRRCAGSMLIPRPGHWWPWSHGPGCFPRGWRPLSGSGISAAVCPTATHHPPPRPCPALGRRRTNVRATGSGCVNDAITSKRLPAGAWNRVWMKITIHTAKFATPTGGQYRSGAPPLPRSPARMEISEMEIAVEIACTHSTRRVIVAGPRITPASTVLARTSWPGDRGSCSCSSGSRKVRTSQSRVIADGNPRRLAESATENRPPPSQ